MKWLNINNQSNYYLKIPKNIYNLKKENTYNLPKISINIQLKTRCKQQKQKDEPIWSPKTTEPWDILDQTTMTFELFNIFISLRSSQFLLGCEQANGEAARRMEFGVERANRQLRRLHIHALHNYFGNWLFMCLYNKVWQTGEIWLTMLCSDLDDLRCK